MHRSHSSRLVSLALVAASVAFVACDDGTKLEPGKTLCGSVSVDLLTDRANCGACGTTCDAGEICDGAGECAASCGDGLTACGEMCRDLAHDPSHCLACGNACPSAANAAPICLASGCSFACLAGWADCDVTATNGCESEVAQDEANCGRCGVVCDAGKVCGGGECVDPPVLWSTGLSGVKVTGDLRAAAGASSTSVRAAADAICEGTLPSGVTCAHVHAFLSIDADDEVRDMPTNYGVPRDGDVSSPTGTVIDSSFIALLDGNLMTSLLSAGAGDATGDLQLHWTGTATDGSLDPYNCKGFTHNGYVGGVQTTTGNDPFAQEGSVYATDAEWIARSGVWCGNTMSLLCLCY